MNKKNLIFGVGAGVVIVGVSLGVASVCHNTLSSPAASFISVHMNALQDASELLGACYDTSLDNLAKATQAGAADLTIQAEPSGQELLGSLLSEDLSWLNKASLSMDAVLQDEGLGCKMDLSLNDKNLVTLDYALSEDQLYLRLPELSDSYLSFAQTDLSISPIMGGDSPSLLLQASDTLPDKKTIQKLLLRYGQILLSGFPDINREKAQLTCDGITQKCTLLTATITEQQVVEVLGELLPQLKEDEDVEELIRDLYETNLTLGLMDSESYTEEQAYQDFLNGIDTLLENLSEQKASEDFTLVYKVWVNRSGEIAGIDLAVNGESFLTYSMPMDGEDFTFSLWMGNDSNAFCISGSGTKTSSTENGNFQLLYNDTTYLTLEISDLDLKQLKEGFLCGSFTFTPGLGLAEGVPELTAISLQADVTSEADTSELALALSSADTPLFTAELTSRNTSDLELDLPTGECSIYDGSDETAIISYLLTLDTDQLISTLRNSDLPEKYTDSIEEGINELLFYAQYLSFDS
jgi:hypothetical protein